MLATFHKLPASQEECVRSDLDEKVVETKFGRGEEWRGKGRGGTDRNDDCSLADRQSTCRTDSESSDAIDSGESAGLGVRSRVNADSSDACRCSRARTGQTAVLVRNRRCQFRQCWRLGEVGLTATHRPAT